MTILNDNIEMGLVTLRVKDLPLMTDFYSRGLGLTIKEQNDTSVTLGTSTRELVKLVTDDSVELSPMKYTGIYHLALLLPERNDLLAMIYFLQNNSVSISGAADHLFSEAIYLDDPEGNGLEIYADCPRDTWVYEPAGGLKGVSDPLNIDDMIARFDGRVLQTIPEGTIMGHVHLSIKDLKLAHEFYVGVLGLEVVMELPSALFLSRNNYHHHLGMNTWVPVSGKEKPTTATGLVSFEILVDNLASIEDRLTKVEYPFHKEDDQITLEDGQGIVLVLRNKI